MPSIISNPPYTYPLFLSLFSPRMPFPHSILPHAPLKPEYGKGKNLRYYISTSKLKAHGMRHVHAVLVWFEVKVAFLYMHFSCYLSMHLVLSKDNIRHCELSLMVIPLSYYVSVKLCHVVVIVIMNFEFQLILFLYEKPFFELQGSLNQIC